MFDCIDVALQAFRSVVTDPAAGDERWQAGRLASWLRDDAIHAIDDLVMRPDFRTAVRWSADRLVAGADTKERGLVEEVDQALVNQAKAMLLVAEDESYRRLLFERRPSDGIGTLREIAPEAYSGLGTVRFIARRPWNDLVSQHDFWGITDPLNLRSELNIKINPIEFCPAFQDRLRQPIDNIVAGLLRRIDYWSEDLQRFRHRWGTVAMETGGVAAWPDVEVAASAVQSAIATLKSSLTMGPQARLREACAALLQTYAEICPSPDLSWLSSQLPPYPGHLIQFWLRHGKSSGAVRIAGALTEVSSMYRRRLSPDEVLSEAARSHSLVIAQGLGSRFLSWHGERVPGPWKPKVWDVMWALSLKAKQSQGIDHLDFANRVGLGDPPQAAAASLDRHALSCLVNRLKKLLPRELRELVDGLTVPGAYLLDVAANEVYAAEIFEDGVFEVGANATYREVREALHAAGI